MMLQYNQQNQVVTKTYFSVFAWQSTSASSAKKNILWRLKIDKYLS